MKKTDYELLNELYDQNISEAIPAVVGAVGKAAGAALAHKAGEGIADTMSSATGDPREVVTADVDSEFNDTSNELGDKLKSANVELSQLIQNHSLYNRHVENILNDLIR